MTLLMKYPPWVLGGKTTIARTKEPHLRRSHGEQGSFPEVAKTHGVGCGVGALSSRRLAGMHPAGQDGDIPQVRGKVCFSQPRNEVIGRGKRGLKVPGTR